MNREDERRIGSRTSLPLAELMGSGWGPPPVRTVFQSGTVFAITSLGVSLLSSCGSRDTKTELPEQSSVRSSVEVPVLVTPGIDARREMPWEIASSPDLVIGNPGTESGDLFRIRGVQETRDGTIIVLDGGSRELRFYDEDGNLLQRSGGKGEGPGEFENPVLVHSFGTDSLVVWDIGLHRFQVFSPSGQGVRTIRLKQLWPSGGRPPSGAFGDKMLVADPVPPTLAEIRSEGAKVQTIDFLWINPSSGTQQRITSVSVERSYRTVSKTRPSGTSVIPFTALPSATVSSRGALITPGNTPEIMEFDSAGHLSRVLRVDEPRTPVTKQMIDAMVDLQATDQESQGFYEWLFDEMPLPDSLPVFQSLTTDAVGWIWAELYRWDPSKPPVWMVFDPNGHASGTIATPQGMTVSWIGESAILGVWRDEFEVEYVHRYPLAR